MVPGTRHEDCSCRVVGDNAVCFTVRKEANKELATNLGMKEHELQFVSFNPFAVPDGSMRVTIRVPWRIQRTCDKLKMWQSNGFMVAEVHKASGKESSTVMLL
jgi:hypothetical protein